MQSKIAHQIYLYRQKYGIGDNADEDWRLAGEFQQGYDREHPEFWASLWNDCLELWLQARWK